MILQVFGSLLEGCTSFSNRYCLIWCFDDGDWERCETHWSKTSQGCSTGLRSGDFKGHRTVIHIFFVMLYHFSTLIQCMPFNLSCHQCLLLHTENTNNDCISPISTLCSNWATHLHSDSSWYLHWHVLQTDNRIHIKALTGRYDFNIKPLYVWETGLTVPVSVSFILAEALTSENDSGGGHM